jgi:hypothetical protein
MTTHETLARVAAILRPLGPELAPRAAKAIWAQLTPMEQSAIGWALREEEKALTPGAA